MPAFKPAYLIHGDDHGRIAERRAALRTLAERASGAQGVELFEGDRATPQVIADALNALTFAIGRRFLIVDGAERFKEKELGPLLAALADVPPETTVSFFAREDGRLKVPKALVDAVTRAGGAVSAELTVKPWELPRWVVARARELRLDVSSDAARALIDHVGDRQQRLLRELETLELELRDPDGDPEEILSVDVDLISEVSAASSERKVWALADRLLSGDGAATAEVFCELRGQGDRPGSMIYALSGRLRDAHRVAAALERGASASEAKTAAGLRMPPKAQDALVRDASRMGAERLRRGVELIATLEAASHGGRGTGALSEDSRMLLAIRELTG